MEWIWVKRVSRVSWGTRVGLFARGSWRGGVEGLLKILFVFAFLVIFKLKKDRGRNRDKLHSLLIHVPFRYLETGLNTSRI